MPLYIPSTPPILASVAEFRAGTEATKPITSAVVANAFAQITLTVAQAAVGIDFSTFFNATMIVDANLVFGPPSGMTPGKSGTISIGQDSTGGRTIAFNAAYRLPSGGITLEAAPSGVTIIPFQVGAGGAVRLFPASKWT